MKKLTKTFIFALAMMTCSITANAERVPENKVTIVDNHKSENEIENKDHGSQSTPIFIGYYEEDKDGNPKPSITDLGKDNYYNTYYFDKEVILPELQCPGYIFEGYLLFGAATATLEKQNSIPAGFTTYENVNNVEGDDKLVICEAIFKPCTYYTTFKGIENVNNKEELLEKLKALTERTYNYKSDKWDKLPDATDPTMKRDGYSFNGWKITSIVNGDKEEFENKCGVDEDGYIYGISECAIGSVTIEATWKENDYYITYDPNGGSGNAYTERYEADSIKTKTELKLWTPKKSGYDFIGWYIDGKKIVYTTDITKHVATAFAQWFPEGGKATLNFDTAGGNKIESIVYEMEDEKYPSVEFPIPERKGYKFIGWKDQNGNKITESIYLKEMPKEMTLVAEWKELPKTATEEPKNDEITDNTQKSNEPDKATEKNTETTTAEVATTEKQEEEKTSSIYRLPKLKATKITKVTKKQIKFKKIKYAEKYEVQISTNKNMKHSKTYTTAKTVYKFKKLKSKKKYYVRVRGITESPDNTIVYSKWSKKKCIK